MSTSSYYGIFPTMIYEEHYNTPKTIKDSLENNMSLYLSESGEWGESSGKITMHCMLEFSELFQFATQDAKKFVAGYRMDPELFNYNIVKTWANVLRDSSTPWHHHRDAHISFVYYVNIPENQKMAIKFYDTEYKHEPFSQMLRCNPVTEYNHFNSTSWFFDVTEGQIMVFPSSLPHSVDCSVKNNLDKPTVKTIEDFRVSRISVAGDIILTHKTLTTNPLGLQPIKNWRTF